jgi:hypothetical protein
MSRITAVAGCGTNVRAAGPDPALWAIRLFARRVLVGWFLPVLLLERIIENKSNSAEVAVIRAIGLARHGIRRGGLR